MLILVHKSTGKPVLKGEELTDFRGDKAIFCYSQEPRHPGSTGRAYVKGHIDDASDCVTGYYPSVFGLEWKEIE